MENIRPSGGQRTEPATQASGRGLPWQVRRFESIDSTNSYLISEAKSGREEGLVAVAAEQTAGRGRMGRTWQAPPGSSLLMSVLLRPDLGADDLHLAVVVVSLAAADACSEVCGVELVPKWPNDLLAGPNSGHAGEQRESDAGKKVAGILSEVLWKDSAVQAVVVGIGMNINWADRSIEGESLSNKAASLNQLCGHEVDQEAIMDRLLSKLAVRYRLLSTVEGRNRQMSEYRSRCSTISKLVRVEIQDEIFEGTVLDVDDCGRLLIDVGACLRTVAVGDVVHLDTNTGKWTR